MVGHYYNVGRKFTTKNERLQNALTSMYIGVYGSDDMSKFMWSSLIGSDLHKVWTVSKV